MSYIKISCESTISKHDITGQIGAFSIAGLQMYFQYGITFLNIANKTKNWAGIPIIFLIISDEVAMLMNLFYLLQRTN